MSKTVNSAQGSSDVVIAKGTLTISEPIKLKNIRILSTDKNWLNSDNESRVIKDVKIEIGGSSYYTESSYNSSRSGFNYTTTDEDIYVSKTSEVRVLVNLRSDAPKDATVTFAILNGSSIWSADEAATYDNSNEDRVKQNDIAGSLQLATLNVKEGRFNITNKSSSTQKVVANNTDEVTIFDGEITSKEGTINVNDLFVSWSFKANTWSTASSTNNGLKSAETVDITLYVNGNSYSTITFRGSDTSVVERSFSSLGEVSTSESMKIKITAQPNIATTWEVTYSVRAAGTDSNGNSVSATAVNTAKLQITEWADLSLSTTNSSSSVVKDWSNSELISFTTQVKNGSFELGSVKVNFSGYVDILDGESISLEIDGSTVDSETYHKTNDYVTINWLNETLEVWKHTIAIKSNLNASGNDSKFKIKTVELANTANTITKTLSSNATKLVVKAFPTISASTSNEDLILKITNPSDSDENIDILGIGVNGKVVTASLNDKTLTVSGSATAFTDSITWANVSLWAGESTEFRIQAAKSSTVQVTSMRLKAWNQTYVLTSDYTNVGKWTSFKVSGGDKGSDPVATLTANNNEGTSSAS